MTTFLYDDTDKPRRCQTANIITNRALPCPELWCRLLRFSCAVRLENRDARNKFRIRLEGGVFVGWLESPFVVEAWFSFLDKEQ